MTRVFLFGVIDKKSTGSKKSLNAYTFGFQGQEKDDEIHGSTGTHINFKFRGYDPRIGRFWSIDPLTANYPYWTPYAFSGNRVIDRVELEGLEPSNYYLNMYTKTIPELGKEEADKIIDQQASITIIGMGIVAGFFGLDAPFDLWDLGKDVFTGNWVAVPIDLISLAPGGDLIGDGKKVYKKFYRYVGEGEKKIIDKTKKIPNVDKDGNLKKIYITDKEYKTAGRAKTHNQLPNKPAYKIEIDPKNVKDRTDLTKVKPEDNPQWGIGGGNEATTKQSIKVDPEKITKLKGAE